MTIPFHLAFPVHDLEAARGFYAGLLGCPVGREDARWIDFDFFGHQITAHLVDGPARTGGANEVDGDDVPVRHFGAILGLANGGGGLGGFIGPFLGGWLYDVTGSYGVAFSVAAAAVAGSAVAAWMATSRRR